MPPAGLATSGIPSPTSRPLAIAWATAPRFPFGKDSNAPSPGTRRAPAYRSVPSGGAALPALGLDGRPSTPGARSLVEQRDRCDGFGRDLLDGAAQIAPPRMPLE